MRLAGIQYLRSPNHSSRGDYSPEVIVVHYDMGNDGRRNAAWMCQVSAKRAPHFYVFRDGVQYQLVDTDRAAWHAGASEWNHRGEMTRNVNHFSIGIELANLGLLYRSKSGRFYYENNGVMYPYHGHPPIEAELCYDDGRSIVGWWEPYPDVQISALVELIAKLQNELGVGKEVTGHESVGMPLGRKIDPGGVFPWHLIAGAKIRTTSRLIEPG